jgi:hypothetical protein
MRRARLPVVIATSSRYNARSIQKIIPNWLIWPIIFNA